MQTVRLQNLSQLSPSEIQQLELYIKEPNRHPERIRPEHVVQFPSGRTMLVMNDLGEHMVFEEDGESIHSTYELHVPCEKHYLVIRVEGPLQLHRGLVRIKEQLPDLMTKEEAIAYRNRCRNDDPEHIYLLVGVLQYAGD